MLLPCDHLPSEIPPKPKPNKRITETAAENTNQDESEAEDECACNGFTERLDTRFAFPIESPFISIAQKSNKTQVVKRKS